MTSRNHTSHCSAKETHSAAARLVSVVVALSLLALALCLSACTSNQPQAEPQAQSDSKSVTTPTDDSEVSEALVIYLQGDQALFVDQETNTPYVPTLPLGQIYDAEGNHINASDFAVGNIVQVSGNGIMLESYPGQYPGIARVQVLEQGNPADADAYADVIEMWAGGADESAVPYASLEYSSDLGQITLSLDAYDYEWHTADGQTLEKDASLDTDAADGSDVISDSVLDASITAPTQATLSFSHTATAITIERESVALNGQGKIVENEGAGTISVACSQIENNQYTFDIEPGCLYEIEAHFDNGEADFAFHTLNK